MEPISLGDQLITVLVKEQGTPWLILVVYASLKAYIMNDLWLYLRKLGSIVNIAWVVAGEVNQPLDIGDKKGGKPFNQTLAHHLKSTIDDCNLIDMGFQGTTFTWTNGCIGAANIREQIVRAWCNIQFIQQFERVMVQHLNRTASDHHPLLLGVPQTTHTDIFTGFRFLEVWFRHPDFGRNVEEFWKPKPHNLSETMAHFKKYIWQWNKEHFGNIFWRKRRCQARIIGVQKILESKFSPSLTKLEIQLLQELTEILTQEELYWRQQARIQWLTHGERNTRYFHAQAKQRQRHNRIH